MKKLKVIFMFMALLIFGCRQGNLSKGFTIKGNVKDLKNAKLLVLKFVNGGIETDSINVKNNEFQYYGSVKEPFFVQLLIKEGESTKGKLTEFMIENSEIKIEGNSVHYDSIRVFGSESDQILKKYLKEDQKLADQWSSLKVVYDRYVKLNDTINRKKTAKELNKILKTDRIDLLKSYVSEHSESTVGALLPSFCTIENVLTEKNYEELYESLSHSIQKTNYGKEILKKWNVRKSKKAL